MTRSIGTALFALAMASAALGCNLILGNDVHDLAPPEDATSGPGGGGGSSGSGSGGQGGIAGQGGAAGGQGATAGQDGAAGDGGTAGRGGAAGEGGATGRGGAAGQGGTGGRGASTGDDGSAGSISRDSSTVDSDAGQPPNDAAIQDGTYDAADACVPNTTECRGRNIYLCTPGGQWIEILQCSFACVSGACAGDCVPGTHQCSGPIPQSCDATGKWQNGTSCPYVCSQGQCTGMCIPGSTLSCGSTTTCNANGTQTCDAMGIFGPCLPAPGNCATVPQDWEPVALTQANCPSGFGSPQLYYTSATGAPYTCSCSCGGSQSCGGYATLNEYFSAAACAAQIPDATTWFEISTSCAAGTYGHITGNHLYALSDIVYGAGPTCYASPTPTTQPPVAIQTINMCWPDATCPSGACLSTDQSLNLCVYKIGTNVCPAGYPKATMLAPWYDDSRSCGACTCESSLSCTLSDVVLNNDANCGIGHPYMMSVTTACSTASINYPLNAVKATGTSTGSPTCVEKSPSNPMGGVSLNSGTTATVCCK